MRGKEIGDIGMLKGGFICPVCIKNIAWQQAVLRGDLTRQSRPRGGVMRGGGAWTSITLIESSNIKRGNWDKVGVTDGSLTNLY